MEYDHLKIPYHYREPLRKIFFVTFDTFGFWGFIESARSKGQSLEELKTEVLADDDLLDLAQRQWLSHTLEQASLNWPQSG